MSADWTFSSHPPLKPNRNWSKFTQILQNKITSQKTRKGEYRLTDFENKLDNHDSKQLASGKGKNGTSKPLA
jgi:hypothetical protein